MGAAEKIRKFKKKFTFFSAIIGILMPILCWMIVPIDLLKEPLSKFGIEPGTYIIWTIFIQIISLYLFLNYWIFIDSNKNLSILNKFYLKSLSLFSSISLSLTGLIDMRFTITHIGFAALFFLSYAALVFWTGFLSIKSDFKFAKYSIIISMIMITSSFSIPIIKGLAPFEILFIILIILWNLKISKE